MTADKVIRWWPPVGLSGLVLLGLVVGKGSTALDDWFIRVGSAGGAYLKLLGIFTTPWVLVLVLGSAFVVALVQRRWLLAVAMVVTPAAALAAVRFLKPVFGREIDGGLAYPSGHVSVAVVVLGMVVLVAGAQGWQLAAAAVVGLLALLGPALTFHYFTDTVGAVLLATSLVCLAARATELDRCQPSCDLDHSAS